MATAAHRIILKDCRYLVTQDDKRTVLEHVDVLVEGNRIAAIEKHLLQDQKSKDVTVIDCSDRIVMPGIINCHTHLGMSDLRGLHDDDELAAWLKIIIAAEHDRTHAQILDGARAGVRESLRTGTTTCCDMYDPGDVAITAAREHGMRLVACPSFFTAHRKLDDQMARETISAALPDPATLPSTITLGLGPHSIYGCPEQFLRDVRDEATKRMLPLHIHVAETRKERVECYDEHAMLPVQYLEHLGFLGKDVLIAHAVWLTKGELDTLAKRDVKIVHCPQSNMKLAGGGVLPLREMLERGITVALGTDSTASNNSLDMFREMHVCALLHKHHYWDPKAADAQTVLDMATVNGAVALNIDAGSIAPGKLADIITLSLSDENLQPIARERIVSHLVYAANGLNVRDVIIDGRIVVRDGKIVLGSRATTKATPRRTKENHR
jgi:5-methylthioadenosine/S-adenosylhomocysteine deaminase